VGFFLYSSKFIDFNISIEIENKIPRIDFIEMMEDSYETSIIDFLAEEFTDKIIRNPDFIKNLIKDKIDSIVYKKNIKKVGTTEIDAKESKTTPVKRSYKKRANKKLEPNKKGDKRGAYHRNLIYDTSRDLQ